MNKSQKAFYRLFSEHGSQEARVTILPSEVLAILIVCLKDLQLDIPQTIDKSILEIATKGFYNITFNDIQRLPKISIEECFDYINKCGATNINGVLFLYFKNMCDLYRRRSKYYHILQTQPFPHAEQVGPRSLLEFGNCDNALLANWLEWRKWIFDIDNRSAQETGYVFEPILASCLGGVSVSASNSPVKRIDNKGKATGQGRQVDCYVEDENAVYELKMRVTVAASGQGRFSEEMSFPYEAMKAGKIPILVVFDNTESSLLVKLKERYMECGGKCYIGNAAWNILKERAGREMGLFIDKYIYPPIKAMDSYLKSAPSPITLTRTETQIVIENNDKKYVIEGRESFTSED